MKPHPEQVERFLRSLKRSPTGSVFNPWWQKDPENDIGPATPRIRRQQLRIYLGARLGSARLAVVGEALGYRGGHFTGIAMTSERILLGRSKRVAVSSDLILPGFAPQQTSARTKCPSGFSEPTATIVWAALLEAGFHPLEFVLWNAFPWHSFDPRAGLLSNRMPTKREQAAGQSVLKAFLDLFSFRQVIALGKIAAGQLAKLKVQANYVRHPASGGARMFRQQVVALFRASGSDSPRS